MRSFIFIISIFTAVLILAPASFVFGQSDFEKGKSLFEEREFAKAREVFESVVKSAPENHTALYYLGRTLLIVNEVDKSIDPLEKAIELNGTNADYHFYMGIGYQRMIDRVNMLKKMGYAGKCRESWLKAIEIDPAHLAARNAIMDYYLQAPGIAGGSVDKAREQAQKIKDLDAFAGHMGFAKIHLKDKKPDLAEKEYLAVLEIKGDDRQFLYDFGIFYQDIKEYNKASELFEKAVKLYPDALESLYQIGRTAAFSGENLDKGIEALTEYVKHEVVPGLPGYDGVYWRMGMIYELKNDLKNAVIAYEKSLKVNPDYKEAKDALKKVRKKIK